MSAPDPSQYLAQFAQTRALMIEQLRRTVVGQAEVIEQIMAAIFTRGHCLLVGVPGLAKTLMVRSISQILDVTFKRIQFTPDLMPSDITGTTVLDDSAGRREFRFVRGPIFASIVLADEINRTPPKTQAALLEAMQERQVSVGMETYSLPEPFFVIATQNPIEQEGTYPLPEAQLDRFMFNVKVDYPTAEEEKRIVFSVTKGEQPQVSKVLSAKAIVNLQKLVRAVAVGEYVIDYVVRLVRASRPHDPSAPEFVKKMVDWGAGPRAQIYLVEAGKAFAAMDGRFSVAIDDIKKAAIPVLRHRISTNFQAQAEGKTSEDIVLELLKTVGDPEVAKYQARASAELQSMDDQSMWFRVFGTNDIQPEPAEVLDRLRSLGVTFAGEFGGDAHGWFRADFTYDEEAPPIHLERFLAADDDIRDDLNAWAAWLETVETSPVVPRLMQHMIDTKQLFTLRCPRDVADLIPVQKLCVGLCQLLAEKTKGVYQVDTQGFFAPDGQSLVRETTEQD